ncbi:MAG: lysylphosphatidylglycerol synthase transmembrane domain-containing protein [Chloroflexota bacterium]|nr:lysylphosphatidylglycerol synthase transmembrane domain-containing protein [Chloroflexota bacterium]
MIHAEARARWAQAGRWIVGIGVAGLSCWLLIRDLDWQAVIAALISVDYRWVAAGVLAIIATFFTRARRWQALLWQSNVSLLPAMTALLVGQVVNLALPMRSGDVVRAVWIGPEKGASGAEALGSVAVEKVWDLLALLACGLILLAWMPLPGWFARSTWGTALALGLGGGILWIGLRWQAPLFHWAGRFLARLPAGWDRTLLPRLQRLANGLESIRQPDVSARALFWTGLTWGLGALANLAVLEAFGIPSVIAALFLLAALMVGGTVPTPGRLGIYEGICVVSLALFDIPRDQALAVGVVLHLVVMGPPLVAAALLAFRPRRHSRRSNEPA